jgi:hypothetical protein
VTGGQVTQRSGRLRVLPKQLRKQTERLNKSLRATRFANLKKGRRFWHEISVARLWFDLTDRFVFSPGTIRDCPPFYSSRSVAEIARPDESELLDLQHSGCHCQLPLAAVSRRRPRSRAAWFLHGHSLRTFTHWMTACCLAIASIVFGWESFGACSPQSY